MTSRRIITALLLSLVCLPRMARAQGDSQPLRLSLDDATARAVAASNRVEEARARGDAAGAVTGERHAATLPQLAALAGYTRTNHVDEFGFPQPNSPSGRLVIYPDIPNNYRTRLDVQWPIYTGGRLEALESAARSEQNAAARDIDSIAVDVRLEVARAFWRLVVTGETQRVVDESLARMSEHVRDVRNQLDAGLVPPNDVLSAQAQEARQRMLSIQARTGHEMAEAELARLVGLDPGTRVVPDAALDMPRIDAGMDALIAEARQHRPERQALEERVAAARSRQRAAQAGGRPAVAVAGGVDYASPNPRLFPRTDRWQPSTDAGVNVSWPFLDGGRVKAETAEASAGVRAVQARLAEFDSVVALEIRQRMSELESSRAELDAADVAVRAATEARRVLGERFAAGVATSTDVVDAQLAILQAQLDRTQAIASARLAEARLNRTLGR